MALVGVLHDVGVAVDIRDGRLGHPFRPCRLLGLRCRVLNWRIWESWEDMVELGGSEGSKLTRWGMDVGLCETVW